MQMSEQNASASNGTLGQLTNCLPHDGNNKCEFSLDLKSRTSIRYASFGVEHSCGGEAKDGPVLVVGTIGTLAKASFVDDEVLEMVGTQGTLRIDVPLKMLLRSLSSLSTQKERKCGDQ